MVGTNSKVNKIKRMLWSNISHWQEIIDEQNDGLLISTVNQSSSSANVQTVILKPNETNLEKKKLYQLMVNKSVNIINQLKAKKRQGPYLE